MEKEEDEMEVAVKAVVVWEEVVCVCEAYEGGDCEEYVYVADDCVSKFQHNPCNPVLQHNCYSPYTVLDNTNSPDPKLFQV